MQIEFGNRRAIADAYVIPNQAKVVIGRSVMQAMDVLVDSKRERLIVNPESPNIAKVLLM